MRRYFQIAMIFGLVALGCAALVVGCRPGEAVSSSSRIAAGWERFAQNDFTLALAEFEAALAALPDPSPARLQALYGLATTWNLRRPGENPERATRLYHEVIAAAPDDDLAAWSMLALARMPLLAPGAAVERPDPVALDKAYQEVIDRFPFHEAGEQAFLLQQAVRLETSQPEQARSTLAALDGFLKTHPNSPYTSGAWQLIGHACKLLDLPERRLEAVLQDWKTAELNPGQDLALTYWRIATVAEFEAGDFDVAREYYRKLIAEYPYEQRVFLAKQELKLMDELEARLRTAEVAGKGTP